MASRPAGMAWQTNNDWDFRVTFFPRSGLQSLLRFAQDLMQQLLSDPGSSKMARLASDRVSRLNHINWRPGLGEDTLCADEYGHLR